MMRESIEFREPLKDDAQAISELFLDRYDEITPGKQAWKAQRMLYLRRHGRAYFEDRIDRAVMFPNVNFIHLAVDVDEDDLLVGYASAIADHSNTTFARLVGLVVHREYERQQIGRSLEIRRQGWADVNERILYGQVVNEHDAALAFYANNGYRMLDTREQQGTIFRIIEHTPPNVPAVTMDAAWVEGLSDEILVY
jgi:GNAT superfamily N-acetyltransferase